ncbi:MAG: hypothetical protein LBK41_03665 [Clostridiales bacterium]|nr:hypothetical protein [Clostridiales bacterium]
MILDKLDIILTILAVVVVGAVSYFVGAPSDTTALRMVLAIVGFYALAFLTKIFVKRALNSNNSESSDVIMSNGSKEGSES